MGSGIMKKLLHATAAIALLAAAGCGNANNSGANGTEPAATAEFVWAQEASDLKPDPAVRYGQLENGMRYAIMANDTPPQTASIRMRIDMGSTYEADDQSGIAHFLEHMAFNGSENVPEGEMIKILERYGLAFGPDTNAYTSFDETVYMLDLPSVDEEVVDTALFIMRETASNLTLDPDAIERERGVILSEERVRNTYGLRRFISIFEFFGPNSILKDRFPIGDTEVIKTAPAERFRDLYDRYYVPERATLVIVGDFDVDTMEEKVRENFGDWTPKGEVGGDPDLGTVDANRETEAAFFYDEAVPTLIAISALKPYTNELDTTELRKRDTIRAIANSIVSRRFDKISRQPDSPIIGGSASYDEFFRVGEGPSIDVTGRPEAWQDGVRIAEQELRRALEYGFTQAEIDEQVANFRTNLRNGVQQAETRETPSLANSIVGSVNGDRVFTTPQSALDRFESFADELTPEIVHEAFKEQWAGLNPLIHVSNNVEIADAENAIMTVYTESRATEVTAPEESSTIDFAYTDFGTPGEVVSDNRIEDINVRQVVFDNNVKLSLKQTDFEDGIVRISLRIGGGELEFPTDKDGLNILMDNFFGQGGLGQHSQDELQTITAGRSVSLGIGVGDEAFGGTFATTPQDLLLQMQLAAAYLTDPGYRPEADAQAKALLKVYYPTLAAQPGGIVARDVQRIIHGGDIRFGFGSLDALLARSMDELKPIIARAQTEGAIEIAIVGDFEEQAAIDAVAQTFGALPDRLATPMDFPGARDVSFPAGGKTLTLTHRGEEYQALAITYWPGIDASDIKRARIAAVTRAVLDLKLTEKLREELGATYSPGAGVVTSDVFPGYGYFSASSEVEPQTIDEVFAAIDEIAVEMGSGGVDEDELNRAKKPILEGIENQMEDNGVWLDTLAKSQTDPTEIDNFLRKMDDYDSVTVEEVVAMAQEYLVADKALKIRIVHESQAGE